MLNEKVCQAYVENSRDRQHMTERWEDFFNAMPLGVPMTATEIAKWASVHRRSYWEYGYHAVTHAMRALCAMGAVKREEVPIEPYEIEVERPPRYDYGLHAWVSQPPKKITIDKKTVFIRLV